MPIVSKQHSATRHRQAAVRAVVRRPHQPLVGERDEQRLQRALGVQIERRRHAAHQIVHHLQVFAAAELAAPLAEQDDDVAGFLESPADDAIGVLQQTDDADDRRRIDRRCRRSRCRG